jgi:hypothetical protein
VARKKRCQTACHIPRHGALATARSARQGASKSLPEQPPPALENLDILTIFGAFLKKKHLFATGNLKGGASDHHFLVLRLS